MNVKQVSASPSRHSYSDAQKTAISAAAAETVFVVLPFVIYGIFLGFHNKFLDLLTMPEWSIVSIVVSGQALVRFGSGAVKLKNVVHERVMLVSTLLLLCVIVNVTVLMLVLSTKVGTLLGAMQITMFAISSIIFFLMAYGDDRYQHKQDKPVRGV